MNSFTAVYENGVLRPTEPVSLPEGASVAVIVLSTATDGGGDDPAAILARIARLPREGGTEAHAARDHDRHLYGEGRGR